jgi:hypothetical protein
VEPFGFGIGTYQLQSHIESTDIQLRFKCFRLHNLKSAKMLATFISTSLSTFYFLFMLRLWSENNYLFELIRCVTIAIFWGKIIISAHFQEYFKICLNIT